MIECKQILLRDINAYSNLTNSKEDIDEEIEL